MIDTDCVEFLRWALPRLGLRWAGFRKVRQGVCKRIARRMKELGCADISGYRDHLKTHPREWEILNRLCRVGISRFYRDKEVFLLIAEAILPERIEARKTPGGTGVVRCWSAGCASGEEGYTLSLIWRLCLGFPPVNLELTATDADKHMITRARSGRYPSSSLKELPNGWREAAFEREGSAYRIKDEFRESVDFSVQDFLEELPEGNFDVILCRNAAFTYLSPEFQQKALARLSAKLYPGGYLVIGQHEFLPSNEEALIRWREPIQIFCKAQADRARE